jgi:hypothetical protein
MNRRDLLLGIGITPAIASVQGGTTIGSVSRVQLRTVSLSGACLMPNLCMGLLNPIEFAGHPKESLRWRFGLAALAGVESMYMAMCDLPDLTEAMKRGVASCLEGKFLGVQFTVDRKRFMECSLVEHSSGRMLGRIINFAVPRAVEDLIPKEVTE